MVSIFPEYVFLIYRENLTRQFKGHLVNVEICRFGNFFPAVAEVKYVRGTWERSLKAKMFLLLPTVTFDNEKKSSVNSE